MTYSTPPAGTIAGLWRYPVKSMQGEPLNDAIVTDRGLLGDRVYGIVERETGHVASAKHPRKWSALVACRAQFVEPPRPGAPPPPVWITLPDGTRLHSADPDIDERLSRALGRDVTLTAEAPPSPTRQANRAPADADEPEEVIREEPLAVAAPDGTLFDYAPLHLLTTATLARLSELYPSGRFEPRRFRPNILIAPRDDERGFVEYGWLGCEATIGAARLRLIDPSPRCVMTTLAQADLPRDPGILRTIARHCSVPSVTAAPGVLFSAVAGVYAQALHPGALRIGDALRIEDGALPSA